MKFGLSNLESYVVKATEKELENREEPIALLFTEKKKTSDLYKGLSCHFHGRLALAEIHSSDKSLVSRFSIKKFPTLIVVGGSAGSSGTPFEGKIGYRALQKFLTPFAKAPQQQQQQPPQQGNFFFIDFYFFIFIFYFFILFFLFFIFLFFLKLFYFIFIFKIILLKNQHLNHQQTPKCCTTQTAKKNSTKCVWRKRDSAWLRSWIPTKKKDINPFCNIWMLSLKNITKTFTSCGLKVLHKKTFTTVWNWEEGKRKNFIFFNFLFFIFLFFIFYFLFFNIFILFLFIFLHFFKKIRFPALAVYSHSKKRSIPYLGSFSEESITEFLDHVLRGATSYPVEIATFVKPQVFEPDEDDKDEL